jgi:hypothetical protein
VGLPRAAARREDRWMTGGIDENFQAIVVKAGQTPDGVARS